MRSPVLRGFLFTLALNGIALAQPPGGGPGGFRPPPDPLLMALDLDKDGAIAGKEITESPASLKTLDKNKDGQLTREEYTPRFGPPREGPGGRPGNPQGGRGAGGPPGGRGGPPRGGRRGPPLVMALDTDRDRTISKEEIEKAPQSLLTLDSNKNGKLDPDETRFRFGRRGPGGMMRQKLELVKQFDKDKNGILDSAERKQARAHVKKTRSGGGGFRPRPGGEGGPKTRPGERVKPSEVKDYPDRDLYDPKILRTIFLEFPTEDWEAEVADFYRTDVHVPAKLTVDGRDYGQIGARFRGNSSFFTVQPGQKRSFNLTIDYGEKKDLYGYRTLNLLNAHADPSMVREVLFNHIARQYIPAPKANFVKVVINGRSWGIYVNAQQFNKDFLRDWFGTTQGARWKVPAGFRGPGALVYSGSEKKNYESSFQLKSKESGKAWRDLIALCKKLKETPPEKAEEELSGVLDLDRALWFLALDNVLIDGDGYVSRGSDYVIYQDGISGRFHLLPSDSNETFRYSGGGGPGFRPTPGQDGAKLPPLVHLKAENRPICSVLLNNPNLRARYLAHVRAIATEWLDWKKIGPLVEQYHALLDAEVKKDTRKLYTYEAFKDNVTKAVGGGRRSTPGLKQFVEERRAFLLNHPDLKKPAPVVTALEANQGKGNGITVTTKVGGEAPVSEVLLYYTTSLLEPFKKVAMKKGEAEAAYRAEIPPQRTGFGLRYYVEARSAKNGTTAFEPLRAELGAATLKIIGKSGVSSVVINEVLPSNKLSIKDPQGEREDWIELFNRGDRPVNLSGMYLTDSKNDLRKWAFPAGTTIAPRGYLIVWADDDTQAPGLHAGFKLSSKGESVYLVDRNERGNAILSSLTYPLLRANVPFGRLPNGSATLKPLFPTPGGPNRDHE